MFIGMGSCPSRTSAGCNADGLSNTREPAAQAAAGPGEGDVGVTLPGCDGMQPGPLFTRLCAANPARGSTRQMHYDGISARSM